MKTIDVNGTKLAYDDVGKGPETVLFSHGLLMGRWMFEKQLAHLKDRYRVIAYDHRGQGDSGRPRDRSITMDQCAEDAAALIEALGIGPVHFAGLSMGGFVGLRLGARRPELIRSLILMNTSAEAEDTAFQYRLLNFVARWFGVGLVANKVEPIMVGKTFLNDRSRAEEREALKARMLQIDKAIYRAVNGVIEREPVEDEARRIACPVLVIAGAEDAAIDPAKTRRIGDLVPNAEVVTIPNCGHSSSIEAPDAVNRAIDDFLTGVGGGKAAPKRAKKKA
jgi:pimeloyl-ACP methyl ester carboxylesterase